MGLGQRVCLAVLECLNLAKAETNLALKCVDAKVGGFCRLGKGIDNVAELRGQVCSRCKVGIERQLAGTRPRVALTQLTCDELKSQA